MRVMFMRYANPEHHKCSDIHKLYPNMGYILINPYSATSTSGVTLQPEGELAAICDMDGLEQLFNEADRLEKEQKLHILLNTNPLENELALLE